MSKIEFINKEVSPINIKEMERIKVKFEKENPDFEVGSVHEFKATVAKNLINAGFATMVVDEPAAAPKPKTTRKK
jgi:hypothetical protein